MKAGRIFPLVVKQGTFNAEGEKVTLSLPYIHHLKFLPFSENEVLVKKITRSGFLIEALPKHIFQGTASHKIKQVGHKIFYKIEGRGIPNESCFSAFQMLAMSNYTYGIFL